MAFCQFCERGFRTFQGVRCHLRFCEGYARARESGHVRLAVWKHACGREYLKTKPPAACGCGEPGPWEMTDSE